MVGVDFANLLQDSTLVLLLTIFLFLGFARAFEHFSPQRRRFRPFYRKSRRRPVQLVGSQPRSDQAAAAIDVGEQLVAVMAAPFERRRVLSPLEYRVFKIVEDELATIRKGYRVFGQTSLGEILQSPWPDAYGSINSKRVDILVVDPFGWPILAVEYQGSGHYQGTAAARDAIKKEALRKAGVRYVEVGESDSAEQIRSRVREHLG